MPLVCLWGAWPCRGLPKLSPCYPRAHLRAGQCLLPTVVRSSFQEGAWGCRNHLSKLQGSSHLAAGISPVLSLALVKQCPHISHQLQSSAALRGPQIRCANGRAEHRGASPPRPSLMLLHHDLLRWCCGSLLLHGGIRADNARLLFPHNWEEFLIMHRDVSSARSLDAFQPQPDPMIALRFLLFWHSTCELSAPFWEWFLKIICCCSSFSLMA